MKFLQHNTPLAPITWWLSGAEAPLNDRISTPLNDRRCVCVANKYKIR